jgi:hypothetical protein
MRIQREGAQLQPRGMRSAGPGDDQARFLADLRALRDGAAIGYDELAARAHYPSDILKEAENGPYLPTLPILAAYVRACEGDVLEWEERWRRVANEAAGDPGLPVRPAGASPAAVAGARAGVGVVPPDAYDPERIKAALRGGGSQGPGGTHGVTAPAARDNGSGGTGWSFADARSTGWNTPDAPAGWSAKALDTTAPPAGWDTVDATDGTGAGWTATESWDTRDGSGGWDTAVDRASANGNHATEQRNGSFGAIDQEGQLAGSWSQDSELGQQGSEFAWSGLQETEQEPWSPVIEATPESASSELVWPELADTELAQDGPDLSGGELGWSAADTAQEPSAEPAAWNGAHQALPQQIRDAVPEVSGHAQVRAPLQAVAPEAKERSADRLYPLRLLLIIVIAALIGSGLVLLFK